MKKWRWQVAQWFELRWWSNYLHGKDPAAYLQWKRNYWKGIIDKVGEVVVMNNVRTVADMGCGPAGIFIALPDKTVTAVDPLLSEYEKRGLLKTSDFPNVKFLNQLLEDFSAKEEFQMVFCMNAINHVRDLHNVIDVITKATKGYLILTIDAHNYSVLKHLFRLIPGDILHPHQYDLEEYMGMFEKKGFTVVPQLIKKEGIFDHYLLIARKSTTSVVSY